MVSLKLSWAHETVSRETETDRGTETEIKSKNVFSVPDIETHVDTWVLHMLPKHPTTGLYPQSRTETS